MTLGFVDLWFATQIAIKAVYDFLLVKLRPYATERTSMNLTHRLSWCNFRVERLYLVKITFGAYIAPLRGKSRFEEILAWVRPWLRGSAVLLGDLNARHTRWDVCSLISCAPPPYQSLGGHRGVLATRRGVGRTPRSTPSVISPASPPGMPRVVYR